MTLAHADTSLGECRDCRSPLAPLARSKMSKQPAVLRGIVVAGLYLLAVALAYVAGATYEGGDGLEYFYFFMLTLPWVVMGGEGNGVVAGWIGAPVTATIVFLYVAFVPRTPLTARDWFVPLPEPIRHRYRQWRAKVDAKNQEPR
jgi:hypothetical protein